MDRKSNESAGAVAAVLIANTDDDAVDDKPIENFRGEERQQKSSKENEGGEKVFGENVIGNLEKVSCSSSSSGGTRIVDSKGKEGSKDLEVVEENRSRKSSAESTAKDFVISVINVLQKEPKLSNNAENKLEATNQDVTIRRNSSSSSKTNPVDNIIGEQLIQGISHNIVNSNVRNINEETTIESLQKEDTRKASLNGPIGDAVVAVQQMPENSASSSGQRRTSDSVVFAKSGETRSGAFDRSQSVPNSRQLVVSSEEGAQSDPLGGFVTVHILLDRNKLEKVLFSPNQEQKAIVEVLRAASGASLNDILKLYDQSGRCVQITPDLKTEGQNYHLQISKYPLTSPNKVASKFINSELSHELDVILQKIISLERCLFPLRTGSSKPNQDGGLRSPKLVPNHLPNSSQTNSDSSNNLATVENRLPIGKINCDTKKEGRTVVVVAKNNHLSKGAAEGGQDLNKLVPVSEEQKAKQDEQDRLIRQLEMLSTRIQALTTRANEIGAEWIGCGVGVHCAGAFREQFSRRRISLPKHSEVKAKFTMICNTANATFSQETLHLLRMPAFDSYAWSDEELLLLLHGMFTELELTTTFRIRDGVLRQFLYEVYKHYNEVPFHNFRHCFCVSQMMYSMAWRVDLVSRLGHLEVLVLLVSCICHDLDHPGYNNIYQINARTELAIRYNDISPLENHHCSVAFRILEIAECNILESLPTETYRQVREGIIRCILATDMARHNEILAQFRDVTPCFDYDNRTHTNLLSMVLIKVADISNEARPLDVAEPWLDRLLQEFFAQSAAEKQEGLPVTPFMDPDKVSKPSSQVRFIGLVLLPLFEALGELMPELQDLIVQPVRDALEYYRRLNEATKEGRSRKSLADGLEPVHNSHHGVTSPTSSSQSAHSVRSRRSLVPRMSLSISRSIDDNQPFDHKSITPETSHDSQNPPSAHDIEKFIRDREDSAEVDERENNSNDDFEEENDSGDSETATEVEVSEKTLKFKIATEGGASSSDRRNSRIGIPSRKNSHERCTLSHAFGNAYSLDLQKYDYRRGSLGPSSSGGSLGNFCSNCQAIDNTNRCCRGRNSDGSVRSPCSDICQRSQGSAGSHSVRQISEEFEPEADDKIPEKTGEMKKIEELPQKEEEVNKNSEKTVSFVNESLNQKVDEEIPDEEKPKQDFDEIMIDKTSASQETEQPVAPTRSLFARIKQFTDRITFSFDKQYTGKNNNTNNEDIFLSKASTLPKSKQKIESRKSWRILMYNKDRNTTNSIDVLTTDVVDDKSTDRVEI